jgi:hypothetical protein
LARRRILPALLAFLPSIAGCGKCFVERVEVALPARFRLDSQDRALLLRGQVTSRNIDRNSFDAIERAVSDASAPPGVQAVIWTVDQGFDSPLAAFLAFDLSFPVSRNQSLPVVLSSRFAGWGVRSGSPRPGTPVSVYFEQQGFVPVSVEGVLLVHETAPLRLSVDLAFRSQTGNTVRIDGEMQFVSISEKVPCLE